MNDDATRRDAIRSDAIPPDAIPPDAIPPDAIRSDAIRSDVIPSAFAFLVPGASAADGVAAAAAATRFGSHATVDDALLAAALVEARRGVGRTTPNPPVGCVIATRRPVEGAAAPLGDDARDPHDASVGRASVPAVPDAPDSHDVIIARGHHVRAGSAHAEIAALDTLPQGAAAGATVYVTLEPCVHHGRTPPCIDRLIAERVSRVVIGALDPNPRVHGRGVAALRAAGIEAVVATGPLAHEARALVAPFLRAVESNESAGAARGTAPAARRPYVIAKIATSLDGRIATSNGASRWITGEHARALVHRLRDHVDAVLVGAGTVIADDPRLDVRLEPDAGLTGPSSAPSADVGRASPNSDVGRASPPAVTAAGSGAPRAHADARTDPRVRATHNPLRVVLDTSLRTSPRARVYARDPDDPTPEGIAHATHGAAALVITCVDDATLRHDADARARADAFDAAAIARVTVPRAGGAAGAGADAHADSGGVDLSAALAALASRHVQTLLVEAGPRLLTALLTSGLVDELWWFTAPCVLGDDARGALGPLALATPGDAPRMRVIHRAVFGDDALVVLGAGAAKAPRTAGPKGPSR